ncbi:hypothetical protein [Virgibacillus sp. DJP39]|uniref:hypothetical protein n=1 Tax=Virgibacillus sp. DJP39 TaxID=3409790 RepID=UPI003BB55E45
MRMKQKEELDWNIAKSVFQLVYITHRKDVKVTFDLLENIELGSLYTFSEAHYRVGELILNGNIHSNIILSEDNDKNVFERMDEDIVGQANMFEGLDRVAIMLKSIYDTPSSIFLPTIISSKFHKNLLQIKSPHTFLELKIKNS